ncbi:MAG TPA: phytanoyl-CoA dioxygenase family protein [Candidatus Acidoferrum sp.]|nr:phytanoyl-CoA dioxygenase family protein [Candidatus Acidoferrum sp.]
MNDLSQHHAAIGRLFSRPASREEWDRYRLTDEQVEFFQENGYLAGVRILTDEQVDILRKELEELMNPAHEGHELFHEYHSNESTDPDRVVFHALGAWRVTPGFHDLLWNPAFLVPASQLLGGPVRFWHDQLFCKPAKQGGVVAWHQDYSYWTRTAPLAHLTCWIGLDDSNRENGCLNYVPGSHKWPDLPKPVLTGDMDAIREGLPGKLREQFKPVAVELKKGESSFHHARTMHGSGANNTARPRRATVINVFRDGVKSDTEKPLLAGVPVIPRGEKLGGQFFPLLYEAEKTH